MNKKTKIAFLALLFFGNSCALLNNSKGTSKSDEPSYFAGSINYNIEVIALDTNTSIAQAERNKYGTSMQLTIFENGNIQQIHSGTQNHGYETLYLDVKTHQQKKKYKAVDSVYSVDAEIADYTKISTVRSNNKKTVVMGYELDEYGVVAETNAIIDGAKKQVIFRYWYNDQLTLDNAKYDQISAGLWNQYVSKSGSIYLKLEANYFTHKVIYTATSIQPNVFPEDKIEHYYKDSQLDK